MIRLCDYQEEAVGQLFLNVNRLLDSTEGKLIGFKAPTGSGKTVMVAETLKKIIRDITCHSFSFIWIAPHKLHNQSKDKLEKYYEDRSLICSSFEDVQENVLEQNEILFLNWESINKKKNLYIKKNERQKNLETVVNNTKELGRKIILIIDESHYAATSEKSQRIIDMISPDITVEVSATLKLSAHNGYWEVQMNEVKNEEMIKKELLLNPGFLEKNFTKHEANTIIIDESINCRNTLKSYYEQENSKINPLLLIQIPNKRQLEEDFKNKILKLLEEKNLTIENGKVAVWLSDEKSVTLDDIENPENKIEVLIFKQAVALGWDCPRASVMAILREHNSFEFSVQTLGRIMRTPEHKYYQNNELNVAYIFTNVESFQIKEDELKVFFVDFHSIRNNELYENIQLPSIYFQRQHQKNRLTKRFVEIFTKKDNMELLATQINLQPKKLVNAIIADGKTENIDKLGEVEYKGLLELESTPMEIQRSFNNFIWKMATPWAPVYSSDRIKRSLYNFIEKKLHIKKNELKAQKIILSPDNILYFQNSIKNCKTEFKKLVEPGPSNIIKNDLDWQIPKIMSFSKVNTINVNFSIMNPFYYKILSSPEKMFIEKLTDSSTIKWWYKNGTLDKKFFCVLYEKNGKDSRFYVDFIIQFNDGRIGLFDTKDGIFASDAEAGPRHTGLYNYLQNHNNVFGGILVNDNGLWKYNANKEYHYNSQDLSEWTLLNI